MLREILDKKRYAFHDGFDSWQEAVRAACSLLSADGTVPADYAEAVIRNVEEYGPYIVLMPGLALPHAMVDGVTDSAMSLMVTRRPVAFDPENEDRNASVFLTIAASDAEKHMANIQRISIALDDPEVFRLLSEAQNREDLEQIQKYLEAH